MEKERLCGGVLKERAEDSERRSEEERRWK
jgi:hypothetical protein